MGLSINGIKQYLIAAGTAILGKVGIDQTTDGTTNKVQARNPLHDDLNVNANLQVNNADNSLSNPAFVEAVGIDLAKARTLVESSSMVVKATPGTLFSLSGISGAAVDLYLHVFDSATLPADGTAPVHIMLIPAGAGFNFDFTPPYGWFCSQGIVWCVSTTKLTKTLGTASFWVVAQYM